MREDELDQMLGRRAFVPERADFASRIIAASARIRQARSLSIRELIDSVLAEFLPRPAYAMACVLVIGVLLGVGMPDVPSENESAQDLLFQEDGAIL